MKTSEGGRGADLIHGEELIDLPRGRRHDINRRELQKKQEETNREIEKKSRF